jgi:hypothetical protein
MRREEEVTEGKGKIHSRRATVAIFQLEDGPAIASSAG